MHCAVIEHVIERETSPTVQVYRTGAAVLLAKSVPWTKMLWSPSARLVSTTESFTQETVLRVEGVCRVQKEVVSSLYDQLSVKFWLENLEDLANWSLGGVTSAVVVM